MLNFSKSVLMKKQAHLCLGWSESEYIFRKFSSFNVRDQCWGKLLLKVMHYNIALLPKKVTNYVT